MSAPAAGPLLVPLVYLFAVVLALPIAAANVGVGVLLAAALLDGVRRRVRLAGVPADFGWYAAVFAWRMVCAVAADGWRGLLVSRGLWQRLPYALLGAYRLARPQTLTVLHLVALAQSLLVVYALGQHYLGLPVLYKPLFMPDGTVGDWARLRGYSGHANQYAGALAVVLAVTVPVGALADRRLLAYAPVLATGLVLTASRSFLLGSLAGLGLAVVATGSVRAVLRAALAAAAGLVAASWLVPWFAGRMADAFSLARNSIRLRFWEIAWNVFLAHPILGVGAGNLQRELAPYHEQGLIDNALQAHNLLLQELAEGGVLAGLLIVVLHVYFTAKYLRVARGTGDALLRGGALGVAAAFASVLVAGAFEDTFGTAVVALYLGFLMGVVEAYRREVAHAKGRAFGEGDRPA